MTSTRYKQIQRTTTERQCDHKDTRITTDNHKAQSSRAKRETTFTQRQANQLRRTTRETINCRDTKHDNKDTKQLETTNILGGKTNHIDIQNDFTMTTKKLEHKEMMLTYKQRGTQNYHRRCKITTKRQKTT